MIWCEKCGERMQSIQANFFDKEGADHWESVTISEDHGVVLFAVNRAWTGYELTEEEQLECIRCPECGQFPFADTSIEMDEPVLITCFRTEKKK